MTRITTPNVKEKSPRVEITILSEYFFNPLSNVVMILTQLIMTPHKTMTGVYPTKT